MSMFIKPIYFLIYLSFNTILKMTHRNKEKTGNKIQKWYFPAK